MNSSTLGIRAGLGSPLPHSAPMLSALESALESPSQESLNRDDGGLWRKDRNEDRSHPGHFRLPSETSLFSDS